MPACSSILIYFLIIFYAFRKIKDIKNEEKHLSYCVLSLGIVYLLILVNFLQILSCVMVIGLEIIYFYKLTGTFVNFYKNMMVYCLGPLNVMCGTFSGFLTIF